MESIVQHAECWQLACSYCPVGVNSIGPNDGAAVPKQITIVNKTYIMDSASGLEPSVKAEDPAEAPDVWANIGIGP